MENNHETPITSLESGNSDLLSFFKQATSPTVAVVKNEPKSQEDNNFSLNLDVSMNVDNSLYQPSLISNSYMNDNDIYNEEGDDEDFHFKSPSFIVNQDQIIFSIENDRNFNNNKKEQEESYMSVSLHIFDAVTSQDPKFLFNKGGQKLRRKRGITIPDDSKKKDEITLDDLMKMDFLRIGDRLTYTIGGSTQIGILLRGGYIESLNESFPNVHSWVVKVLSNLEQQTKYHWFSPYDAIFIRGKSLNYIRALFESRYYKKDNIIIKKELNEDEDYEDRSDLSRKRVLDNQKPFEKSPTKKLKLDNEKIKATETNTDSMGYNISKDKSPIVKLRNTQNKEEDQTQINIDDPTLPLPDNYVINLSDDSFRSGHEDDDLPTLPIQTDVNLSGDLFSSLDQNKSTNSSIHDDDTTLSSSLVDQPKTYISPMKIIKLSPSSKTNKDSQSQDSSNSPNSKISSQGSQLDKPVSQNQIYKTPSKEPLTEQFSQNNRTPNNQSFDSNKFKTPSPITSQYQSQPLYQVSQNVLKPSQNSNLSFGSPLSSQSSHKPSQNLEQKNDNSQKLSQQEHIPSISQQILEQNKENSQKSSLTDDHSNASQQKVPSDNVFKIPTPQQSQSQQNEILNPSQHISHRIPSQVSLDEVPLSQQEIDESINLPTSKTKEPVILATGLNSLMKLHIISLTSALGGKFVNTLTDEVTHIVCATFDENGKGITKRTVKYQMGILKGSIWMVSFDWILESLVENKWLEEEEFEIQGDNVALGTPFKSRNLLSSKRLFYGYTFYLHGDFDSPSKKELEILIKESGGLLIESKPPRPQNIKELLESKCFVIVNPKLASPQKSKEIYLDTKLFPISFYWVLDSISHYQVLKNEKYILNLNFDSLNLIENQSINF